MYAQKCNLCNYNQGCKIRNVTPDYRYHTPRDTPYTPPAHTRDSTEPTTPYREPDFIEVPSDGVEIPLYQTPIPIRRAYGFEAQPTNAQARSGGIERSEYHTSGYERSDTKDQYPLTPHVGLQQQREHEQWDSTGHRVHEIPVKRVTTAIPIRRPSVKLSNLKNERIVPVANSKIKGKTKKKVTINDKLLRQKRFRSQVTD